MTLCLLLYIYIIFIAITQKVQFLSPDITMIANVMLVLTVQ